VSFALFWTSEFAVDSGEDSWLALFITHYALAIIYSVYLISAGKYGIRKCWKKENISETIVLLNLFFVSAFALNRVINVFEDSVNWLCGYVGMASLTLLSFHFYNVLPKWANKLQHLFLGTALLLFIYQALFVSPFYVVGTVGIIILGVGAHIFVPLTLVIASTILVKFNEGKRWYRWLVAGMIVPILFTAAFVKEWSKRSDTIEKLSNQSVLKQDALLPAWIRIGQWIKVDWITHRLLRYDLVYTTQKRTRGDWFLST
jgi:XrtN system VIT domain protein